MKPLLTLLLSLLCLTVVASPGQPYFVRQQASSSSYTPQDESGLAYWWVASDLSHSPVTNWVDRIKGWQAVATNGGPILQANKLVYYLTNQLNIRPTSIPCAVATTGTNWAVMVIGTLRQINFNGSFLTTSNLSAILQTQPVPHQMRWNSGTYRNIASGTTFDFIYSGTEGVPKTYTNSVIFDSTANAIGNNIDIGTIGRSLNGDIYEVAIWTNAGPWTTSNIARLHNYATNTYHYTP